MRDTIAALSTAPGLAALGIIRISGPEAAAICERLFRPGRSFPSPSAMLGYTLAYGRWCTAEGEVLDEVVLGAFRAPHSYTGEDLYEINFHGGSQIRRSILESLYQNGARPAEAGEFSKRAFLNGKMDLLQAEAVMDLISAESALEQKYALEEMGGSLSHAVEVLKHETLNLIAYLENIIEFSEEEAGPEDYAFLEKSIAKLRQKIENALASWAQGRILGDYFRVCILGLTNAGKSTLLNALMGSSRAIVSDISGTTRDTLEAKIQISGIPVLLTDTAGLRETSDQIEKEGISRALAAAQIADLIFWLHDPHFLEESVVLFREFRKASSRLPVVHILGKQDLFQPAETKAQVNFLKTNLAPTESREILVWSQEQEELLSALRQTVKKAYEDLGNTSSGQILIHNLRHRDLLQEAARALNLAEQSLGQDAALDVCSSMLRKAQEALAGLSGSQVSDELVDAIFSRFCVGK